MSLPRIAIAALALSFAGAVDIRTCEGDEACPARADVLLQGRSNMGQSDQNGVTEEQLAREKKRQEQLTQDMLDRSKLFVAVAVREGMAPDDAVAWTQKFADEFDVDAVDVSSDESLSELFSERMASGHDMVCHIRGALNEEDCEQEYSSTMKETLMSFMNFGDSSLLQSEKKAEKRALLGSGQVDPELVTMQADATVLFMKFAVKAGDDEDAVRQCMQDYLDELKAMSGDSLLSYSDLSLYEGATRYVQDQVSTVCLLTTSENSCSEILADMVGQIAGQSMSDFGSTLLQVGLRPAMKVLVKLLGYQDVPEETAAQRAAVAKAYIAQRRLQE